jgi:hypothetical protein
MEKGTRARVRRDGEDRDDAKNSDSSFPQVKLIAAASQGRPASEQGILGKIARVLDEKGLGRCCFCAGYWRVVHL